MGCLFSIISIIVSWYLKTACMFYGWYWFLIPVFPSLPEINKIQAFGIMLMISLMPESPLTDYKLLVDEEEGQRASLISSIFKPITYALTLFIFWLVHSYFM